MGTWSPGRWFTVRYRWERLSIPNLFGYAFSNCSCVVSSALVSVLSSWARSVMIHSLSFDSIAHVHPNLTQPCNQSWMPVVCALTRCDVSCDMCDTCSRRLCGRHAPRAVSGRIDGTPRWTISKSHYITVDSSCPLNNHNSQDVADLTFLFILSFAPASRWDELRTGKNSELMPSP